MGITDNKGFLAIYDVPGIQKFIFRTNKVQEIIGASAIVDDIIMNGLKEIIKNPDVVDAGNCILEWDNDDDISFLNDETILMEVMFIGGGNAYVMYRDEALCHKVNKRLAKYVLDSTYSLVLATTFVKISENYAEDYDAINKKLREVKSTMPETAPMGAMPFMAIDQNTGLPLTKKKDEYVSTESYLKLNKYEGLYHDEQKEVEKFDNLVKEKGESSLLGVVHIDGNSMGNRIKELMEGEKCYNEAVKKMRKISRNIQKTYQEAFKSMRDEITKNADKVKKSDDFMVRRIITAGDDITYVINGEAALSSAEMFIRNIDGKLLYDDDNLSEEENIKKYGLSACAGIALIHSHFPFSDAYQVAEKCCESAKMRAKDENNKNDGLIGNFLDFQICEHISAVDLGAYRNHNYKIRGKELLSRPYYICTNKYGELTGLNDINKKYDFEELK